MYVTLDKNFGEYKIFFWAEPGLSILLLGSVAITIRGRVLKDLFENDIVKIIGYIGYISHFFVFREFRVWSVRF